VVGATTAHNELSNATGSIQDSIGCLRGKPLIDMVMTSQDEVYVIVV
jgi:hypothetical protein